MANINPLVPNISDFKPVGISRLCLVRPETDNVGVIN